LVLSHFCSRLCHGMLLLPLSLSITLSFALYRLASSL
jgi:hypothetical protein